MVVAGTPTPTTTIHKTTPFTSRFTSETTNNGGFPAHHRRPKSREVSSRYLSTSSSSSTSNSSAASSTPSRRCPSPMPSRPRSSSAALGESPAVKRPQSAERRRPTTPKARIQGEMSSAAAKLLVSSSRRLSVSFQGESYAVPRAKVVKAVGNSVSESPSVRKGTPERRRNSATPVKAGENRRPSDQPWPGRVVSMSRSVDLGSGKVVRALKESLVSDQNAVRPSSGGNLGAQDRKSISNLNSSGVCRNPRHLQEANGLSKRASSPMARTTSLSRTSSFKGTVIEPRKVVNESPAGPLRRSLSARGLSSPIRGSLRPASPSKVGLDRSSPSTVMGRMASPSRGRSAVGGTPSVLCYGTAVRTLKVGDNRLGDAHLLRLLHNRHLQWRFVNARAEALLSIQHSNAQRSLYNAWKATSDLCGAVSSKRQELQWLRLKMKLVSILKGQILHLEEWSLIDKDHCISLSGATESLKASTIRLPLIGGARVDVQDLKDAICSAADVMHSMASSICALSRKVEEMNSLVVEVASLITKERSVLDECKNTLSILAAMQVKDCSLRAHILQLKCTLSSLSVKV
ncbi:hypothetical protein RND81_02G052300 [Saponaria officinalis]|uniref:QWRF motif-containing protein 2 n=1 Tax=Saponaria officinalis TaxID=3572 RepID=A0AAW1MQP5_SAPOF